MSERELSPFAAPSLEQLCAVVFELASQLHVERIRRLALEAALEGAGVMVPGAVDGVAGDAGFASRATAELDQAMGGIIRVLTEDADPRRPMRAQSRRGG